MNSTDIRKKYLEFFKEKGHTITPSASLIPENDSTTLFNTAGMQPLTPFLMGEKHPAGTAIANCQKCIRTGDIDCVGDSWHLTFFEMLGNWPLGAYDKEQMVKWSWEFLTSKKWLGIDPQKIYITIFAGDKDIPKDEESIKYWQECFQTANIEALEDKRIFALDKEENFWGPVGNSGPCGADTEMFVDTGKEKCSDNCKPGCSCGKYAEIWNDVFMFYYKNDDGTYKELENKQIDTGFGLERATAVLNGTDNVYDCDLFIPIIDKIKELANITKPNQEELKSIRIIADHIRSAVFIMGDNMGIAPSNLDQGYVVRRLLRTAIRHGKLLNIPQDIDLTVEIARVVIDLMKDVYSELEKNQDFVLNNLEKEENQFEKTLDKGVKEYLNIDIKSLTEARANIIANFKRISGQDAFKSLTEAQANIIANFDEVIKPQLDQIRDMTNSSAFKSLAEVRANIIANFDEVIKPQLDQIRDMTNSSAFKSLTEARANIIANLKRISGQDAFNLFQTYGFPLELTRDLAKESGKKIEEKKFNQEFKKHKELSRTASAGKFKGGLADHSEAVTKYHTATHLLHQALIEVLGEHVKQKGSNLTEKRLRFDFSHPEKMTDEEIKKVEDLVNDIIKKALPIECEEKSVDEAKNEGAIGLFGDKYGDKVKIYIIGDFSKEICGGPHIENTSELGHFKIIKEQSASAGIRRIKAVLE